MLQDSFRTKNSILTGEGEPRTFKQVRKSVLNILNIFLADVEKSSAGCGLYVDFSKGVFTDRLSVLFTDTGIICMLEGRDFEAIDMNSPFLGAIVDICCGTKKEATVTKCFILYMYLVEFLFR